MYFPAPAASYIFLFCLLLISPATQAKRGPENEKREQLVGGKFLRFIKNTSWLRPNFKIPQVNKKI